MCKIDILIGTLGCLIEYVNVGNLLLGDVEVLVFDEVDRMFDMGFVEDVQCLVEVCGLYQILLFSVIIGGNGLCEMVVKVFKELQYLMFNSVSQLNEGIRQQVITVDYNYHKEQFVDWLLVNEIYDKVIVFTNIWVQVDCFYGKLVVVEVNVS